MSTTNTSPPGATPMRVVQGAVYRRTVTWKDPAGTPRDLTGRTATLTIRRTLTDAVPLFTVTGTDALVLGGAAGTIAIRLGADTTATIPCGTWRWALAVTTDADPTERVVLLDGPVQVRATALVAAT